MHFYTYKCPGDTNVTLLVEWLEKRPILLA